MAKLNKKENHYIEFKREWNDKCLEVICGMANSQGGKLYVGVEDNGEVFGISDELVSKFLKILPEKIPSLLNIDPDINELILDGISYLEIDVEPSNNSIYYKQMIYARKGTITKKLTGTSLDSFLKNRPRDIHAWDQAIEVRATLDDIDLDTIEKFKHDAYKVGRLTAPKDASLEALLTHLNLYTKEEGLTNAAIILFGKDVTRFNLHAYLSIGYFGDDLVEIDDIEDCYGNLIKLSDEMINKIKQFYLQRKLVIGTNSSETIWEYPEAALREIVNNALVHRDYQFPERIRIYKMADSFLVFSPGKLLPQLTIDTLDKRPHIYRRNSLIAHTYFTGGYIEKYGTGISKIKDACKKAGLPKPVFEASEVGFSVKLSNKVRAKKHKSTKLSKNQIKVLELFNQNKDITMIEISNITGLSKSGVYNIIKILKDQGYIKRKGTKKSGKWEVINK